MADSKPKGTSPITITQQGSAVVISDGTRTVRSYYATDRMAKRMVSTLQKGVLSPNTRNFWNHSDSMGYCGI